MVRKSILSLLVIMALFLAGCANAGTGEDANGVGGNGNDVAVTGIPADDANANDFNINGGNANDLNANQANANDNLNGNTNDNLNGNLNGNGNENANGNANDNTNSSGATTTTTPAVPAGTGLANPDTYDLFVQSLTAQGITAMPDADFTTYTFAGFPAGRGRTLDVNGETVHVIEFQDAMTAQAVYQAWQSGGLQLQDYFQDSTTGGSSTDANGNENGNANANSNDANANGAGMTAVPGAVTTVQPDSGMGAGDANVWVYGRILVVYFGNDAATTQMLGRMMNGAASLTGIDANSAALPAAVMTAIQQYAAQQFQAAPESVQIVSVLPVEFQDSCLEASSNGTGGVDSTGTDANGNGMDTNANANGADSTGAQNCAQVVTPGWAITALIDGQQYVLRINQDGSVVRQAPEGLDQ